MSLGDMWLGQIRVWPSLDRVSWQTGSYREYKGVCRHYRGCGEDLSGPFVTHRVQDVLCVLKGSWYWINAIMM